MQRSAFVLILAAFLFVCVPVQTVFGKDYPTKGIEIVCNMSPGSAADLVCRLISEVGSKYLGQPLLVVNKPGAGGSIAVADVLSSKPDGYKLVYLYNTFFITTIFTQKMPFDPDDLAPIANLTRLRVCLAVRGDSPWKTPNDLLDYGKKNPDKIRWGTTGRGIATHMEGLLFFKKAGVKTLHLPYKGGADMLPALLGGHIDASIGPYSNIKDHIKAGKIRSLVFSSDHRFSDLPDVPNAIELGHPELDVFPRSAGLFIHKQTPKNIQDILLAGFKKTYEDPAFKGGVEKLGDELRFEEPEFTKDRIKKAVVVAIPLLKEIGLYVGER